MTLDCRVVPLEEGRYHWEQRGALPGDITGVPGGHQHMGFEFEEGIAYLGGDKKAVGERERERESERA